MFGWFQELALPNLKSKDAVASISMFRLIRATIILLTRSGASSLLVVEKIIRRVKRPTSQQVQLVRCAPTKMAAPSIQQIP